jgi:hypothetical protein
MKISHAKPLAFGLFWMLIFSCLPALPAHSAHSAQEVICDLFAVSLESFSARSLGKGEYAGISAAIDFSRGSPGMSLFFRALVPANPLRLEATLVGAGIELTLAQEAEHPFSFLSPRKTYYAPSISLSGFVSPLDLQAPLFMLNASLLRLYSGWGLFSIGTLGLVFNAKLEVDGWSVKIFEFSYYAFRKRPQ